MHVAVKARIEKPMEFGALGYVVGKAVKGKVPLITGIKGADEDRLKSLAASIVTYGGAPLFHIDGITPEKQEVPDEKIEVTQEDIGKAVEEMNDSEDAEFIFIGCPHCSLEELRTIAGHLKGKKVTKELWIGVARPVKKKADEEETSKVIEESGAKFACDTCHVVAPLKGRFRTIATNSAKGIFYGRGRNKFKTVFRDMKGCLELATS